AVCFRAVSDPNQLSSLPAESLLPIVNVRPLSYAERVAEWKVALGPRAKGLTRCIAEISRRFRYEKQLIRDIARGLTSTAQKITEKELIEACRGALDLDVGDLAVQVKPRFENEMVILP